MFCEKCGNELNQEAKFCVGCGAPNPTYKEPTTEGNIQEPTISLQENTTNESEVNTIETTQPTAPIVDNKMKKLLPKIIIPVVAVFLIFAVIITVVITSAIKNGIYKNKMSKVYEKITETAAIAEDYAALQTKVWRNCIYEDDDLETNKYTKDDYGYFHDDFNDALREFYIGESYNYDLVKTATEEIDALIIELKKCPSKFEDDYKTLKELYIAYSDLADLVIGDSNYSYNTFSEALENAKSEYKSAESDAKIAIG